MKSILKDCVAIISALFVSKRPGIPILMYHAIGENDARTTVTLERFKQQLAFLKDDGWNVISLHNAFLQINSGTVQQKEKFIAITFDDVYRENFDVVVELLREYDFPATFFVPTGLIGKDIHTRANMALPLASVEQLRSLATDSLFTLGSHSVSHAHLPELDQEHIKTELNDSKETLKSLFKVSPDVFSYPRGKTTGAVASLVEQYYSYAVGTQFGNFTHNSPRYNIPRKEINISVTMSQFKWLLKK